MIEEMKKISDKKWLESMDEVYKENILDHYKYPRNFGRMEGPTVKHREFNPLCGDNIEISLSIKDGKVADAKFIGSGCAISMASASMLTEKIKGMPLNEVKKLNDESIIKMLGINLGFVRMKCGLLSLKALSNGLKGVN